MLIISNIVSKVNVDFLQDLGVLKTDTIGSYFQKLHSFVF